MILKEPQHEKEVKVRDHPLQSIPIIIIGSSSVGGIIHGDALNRNSRHYVDCNSFVYLSFVTISKRPRYDG